MPTSKALSAIFGKERAAQLFALRGSMFATIGRCSSRCRDRYRRTGTLDQTVADKQQGKTALANLAPSYPSRT
jgi:hypothetical protein